MIGPAVWAGLRDASWYSCPAVRGVRQYHVALPADPLFPDGLLSPACNPSRAFLNEETLEPAREITPAHRCRRPGCRTRWPACDETAPAGGARTR